LDTNDADMNAHFIESADFGPIAILWQDLHADNMIEHIFLSSRGISAKSKAEQYSSDLVYCSSRQIDAWGSKIVAALRGEQVDFSLNMLNLKKCTPFQQQVLRKTYDIPYGAVATYKGIARSIDRECAARAVGNALGRNPFPIVIPCHRVIRSDGSLGGFTSGPAVKEALLNLERVLG